MTHTATEGTATMNRTEAEAAATIVRDVEHDGHRIIVRLVPAWDERTETTHAGRTYLSGAYQSEPRLRATVDGYYFHVGTQDAAKVIAKAIRDLDLAKANAELLPRLRQLIGGREDAERMGTLVPATETTPRVGDVAITYAQGRMRRGLVTKVARTNVTVAYTTASAPTNVYRPARPAAEVLIVRDAGPVEQPTADELALDTDTPAPAVSPVDYPAVEGRPVTEAHARYCRETGHATRTVNGVDAGVCPRCGTVTLSVDVRRAVDAGVAWYEDAQRGTIERFQAAERTALNLLDLDQLDRVTARELLGPALRAEGWAAEPVTAWLDRVDHFARRY